MRDLSRPVSVIISPSVIFHLARVHYGEIVLGFIQFLPEYEKGITVEEGIWFEVALRFFSMLLSSLNSRR